MIVGAQPISTDRGIATKFSLGGTDSGAWNPPTPNPDFSSDFGRLILKILKNNNFGVFRKKNFKIAISGRKDVPPKTTGGYVPAVLPAATPKYTEAMVHQAW